MTFQIQHGVKNKSVMKCMKSFRQIYNHVLGERDDVAHDGKVTLTSLGNHHEGRAELSASTDGSR